MATRRRRFSRTSKRSATVWRGNQFENIAIGTGETFIVLVQRSDLEKYGKCTVVAVRGGVTFHISDTDSANGPARVGAKILKWRINDASAVTDDVSGLDAHEEDIEQRQLWTYTDYFSEESTNHKENRRVEIFIKGGIILGGEKEEFGLVATSNVATRMRMTGYLRALVKLG